MPIPDEVLDWKPPFEIVDGRLERKMSPRLRHQVLEKRWVAAFDAWAAGRGEAFTEWRHKFTAPGKTFASLVPDVAFVRYGTLERLGPEAAEAPPEAPEIAVEILSAGESQRVLDWKIEAYLAAGTRVVFVVDPPRRTVLAHAADGVVRYGPGETVAHDALPGFAYAVDAMFEGLYLDR